jgi:hypothetical protein
MFALFAASYLALTSATFVSTHREGEARMPVPVLVLVKWNGTLAFHSISYRLIILRRHICVMMTLATQYINSRQDVSAEQSSEETDIQVGL